jgi:hypothetical protein
MGGFFNYLSHLFPLSDFLGDFFLKNIRITAQILFLRTNSTNL